MNDEITNKEAADKLLKLMLDIIKSHRWEIIGRQRVLWKQIMEENGEEPGLHTSEIRQLREYSQFAGGWWTDLDIDKPKFVSLEQWQLIYSGATQENNHD